MDTVTCFETLRRMRSTLFPQKNLVWTESGQNHVQSARKKMLLYSELVSMSWEKIRRIIVIPSTLRDLVTKGFYLL